MAKILIIGASSFLGSNLARDLVEQGHQVGAFILPRTWHPFLDDLPIKIHYGDITDQRSLRLAMRGYEQVYQIAGIVSYHKLDARKIYAVHVQGTKNVLELIPKTGVQKLVVTASTAGIGIPRDKNKPLNEESPFPEQYANVPYMYSKHLCIQECYRAADRGINVSIVSPCTIYGAGDITMHLGSLVKKIKEGGIKIAPPGGNSVVSVTDVVRGLQLAMDKGRPGENYILINKRLPYLELYNIIANLLGVKKIKKTWPTWLRPLWREQAVIMENLYAIFNRKSPLAPPHKINSGFLFRYFDSSKARQELGWQPRVSFRQAIKESIKFYQEKGIL